jgi:hypothetical protein
MALAPTTTRASTQQDAPELEWENYSVRPSILDPLIAPQELKGDGSFWHVAKLSQFVFIAQLLETYSPDTQIYFLARDAEYLFDTAKLVTQGQPDAGRIHLLNISAKNAYSPLLKNYLGESGISSEALVAGKKVLFVDTGFSGTIPEHIRSKFPQDFHEQMRSHFILSDREQIPVSRSLLVHFNPIANDFPHLLEPTTSLMELALPHFTYRSTSFLFDGSKTQPRSNSQKGNNDGVVSRTDSLALMSDLKFLWDQPNVKASFLYYRKIFRLIKEDLIANDLPALQKKMNSFTGMSRVKFEAALRDLIASFPNAGLTTQIKLADFGLEENLIELNNEKVMPSSPKRKLVLEKHPEWSFYLSNPAKGIKEILSTEQWQVIEQLIDAQIDLEIDLALIKNLYHRQYYEPGHCKPLISKMILTRNRAFLNYLADRVFGKLINDDLPYYLELVIQKSSFETLRILQLNGLLKPFLTQIEAALNASLQKGVGQKSESLPHPGPPAHIAGSRISFTCHELFGPMPN